MRLTEADSDSKTDHKTYRDRDQLSVTFSDRSTVHRFECATSILRDRKSGESNSGKEHWSLTKSFNEKERGREEKQALASFGSFRDSDGHSCVTMSSDISRGCNAFEMGDSSSISDKIKPQHEKPAAEVTVKPKILIGVDSHFHPVRLMEATQTDTLADALAALPSSKDFHIAGFIGVFCSPRTWPSAADRVKLREDSRLHFAYGWHPKLLYEGTGIIDRVNWERLESRLGCRGTVALGEIGLDYSNLAPPYPGKCIQKIILRKLLRILKQRPHLTVVLHSRGQTTLSREANDDCLTICREELDLFQRIHLHCFSGSVSELMAWEQSFPNCYFGITGLVTMDDSHPQLSAVIAQIPEDRLLLETDSPYLKTKDETAEHNSPLLLDKVARYVAEIRELDLAQLLDISKHNTERCYPLFRL